MEEEQHGYAEWSIMELMGHRRLGGFVCETTLAGAGVLRIDIPMHAGGTCTQFYPPAALYCLTPVSEEIARAVARENQPRPISQWELPPARTHERRNAGVNETAYNEATYCDDENPSDDDEENDEDSHQPY